MKIFRLLLITLSLINIELSAQPSSPLNIVCTFSILTDITQKIGADKIKVTSLVGPNQDAHVFQPTPATHIALMKADLIIMNGLQFEGWLDRLHDDYKEKTYRASEGIKPIYLPDQKQTVDPHAWHHVKNVKIYAQNIAKALREKDKENSRVYEENLASFLKKLDDLEEWIQVSLRPFPPEQRYIVTAHDGFGYFEDAYDVHFKAPIGLSTEAKPSAQELSQLIQYIKTSKTSALFLENITDHRLIQQISEETGVKIHTQILYSDALSDANGPAATYETFMRHNVSQFIHTWKNFSSTPLSP